MVVIDALEILIQSESEGQFENLTSSFDWSYVGHSKDILDL